MRGPRISRPAPVVRFSAPGTLDKTVPVIAGVAALLLEVDPGCPVRGELWVGEDFVRARYFSPNARAGDTLTMQVVL